MAGLKNLTAGVRHVFKESLDFPRKPSSVQSGN